ncbi:MAG TPA: hypothetical protein VF491_17050 [Vicinamibacterales bacterium]|jgi:hypothetical protein
MSKKKGKPAKAAPKKKAAKTPVKKAVRRTAAKRPSAQDAGESLARTRSATITIYRTGAGNKIRTTPQRLYANATDHIEWNVINLVDGTEVPVTITWPEAGPWGKAPIELRSWDRRPLAGAAKGRYKYVVSALDAVEDPEIEIPDV